MAVTKAKTKTREDTLKDLYAVCAELAGIDLYLEGRLQKHGAIYDKKDGTEVRHKATPSLQYPTQSGRQGRMRIPWQHLDLVERLLHEGRRRKRLLAQHRDLTRELVADEMRSGDAAQKETSLFHSPSTSHPASGS